MTNCPACGQSIQVANVPIQALLLLPRLSHHRMVILETLIRAYPKGVRRERLVHLMYEDDPDGGPEDPYNVLRVTAAHLRVIIEKYGWTIPRAKSGSGNYATYSLQLMSSRPARP